MARETLTIGPAPAEEPCAQLGITDLFEQANLLEIGCYRAALIACYGSPPPGAGFHIERNVHDFGSYRELAVRYIACTIGSVVTLDDALALCWEHMARYVIA